MKKIESMIRPWTVLGIGLSEMIVFHSYVTGFLYFDLPLGYVSNLEFCEVALLAYGASSLLLIYCSRLKKFIIPLAFPVIVLIAGYFLNFFHPVFLGNSEVLPILSGISYGIGGVLLRSRWLEILSLEKREIATLNYSIALLVGLVLSFGITHLTNILAFSLITISSIIIIPLGRKAQTTSSLRTAEQNWSETSFSGKIRYVLIASIIGVAVLQAIVGALNSAALNLDFPPLFASNSVWITRILIFSIFAVILLKSPRRFNPVLLFKVTFPITLGGLLLLALMGVEQGAISSTILLIGYNLIYAACMLIMVEAVSQKRIHPYYTVGLFGSITSLPLAIGFLFDYLPNEIERLSFLTELPVISLICAYLLAMTLLLFSLNEKYIKADRETDKIESFSKKYSLSPRETDVLSYLVKGYSAARIAQELGLSENTIWGYIKSIYAKTDLHTKQSLIAAYEDHLSSSQ